MTRWPWPENRLARRTRIAHLYRDTLLEHAPGPAAALDALLDGYGQHWITGTKPPIDPDEPMTAKEIADWLDLGCNAITNRIAHRRIKPIGTRGNRKTYRLTDLDNQPAHHG
jgi:hypothetical protein